MLQFERWDRTKTRFWLWVFPYPFPGSYDKLQKTEEPIHRKNTNIPVFSTLSTRSHIPLPSSPFYLTYTYFFLIFSPSPPFVCDWFLIIQFYSTNTALTLTMLLSKAQSISFISVLLLASTLFATLRFFSPSFLS